MSKIKVGTIITKANSQKVKCEASNGTISKIHISNLNGRKVERIEGSRFQVEGDDNLWFFLHDFNNIENINYEIH